MQFRDVNNKAAIVKAGKLTKAEAQELLGEKTSVEKMDASRKSKSRKKAFVSKKTARRKSKPGKKASARKKTEKTATDTVLRIMKRYKKGVGVPELKKKTEFDDRKIRNVLHHMTEQGKIRNVGRGIYKMG